MKDGYYEETDSCPIGQRVRIRGRDPADTCVVTKPHPHKTFPRHNPPCTDCTHHLPSGLANFWWVRHNRPIIQASEPWAVGMTEEERHTTIEWPGNLAPACLTVVL